MIRDRLRRARGYVGLSVRRFVVRLTRTAPRRTLATVVGVAIAIALLVIATGLAVGLATQTTVYGDDVDYWVTPEGGGETSALVATEGPQFGQVHETTQRIEELDGVEYATPVLSAVRYTSGSDTEAYILFVGILPQPEMGSVSGLSPAALSSTEQPTPTEEWHGEAVLSDAAAAQLGAVEATDSIAVDGESFDVAAIDAGQAGAAELPIALVHLSDLQQLTGADEFDNADQFLVSASSPAVEDDLAAIHPQSSVDTRADLTASQIAETDSALAIAVGAFVITFVIGTLFVVMTAGLELTSDAATVGTMAAIGVSSRSRLTLAGTQTLLATILGGGIGAGVGLASLFGINAVVSQTVLSIPVASVHPGLAGYGLVAAIIIGLVTLPYVRYLIGRIGPEEVLR